MDLGTPRSTIGDRQTAGLYPKFIHPSPRTAAIYADEHQRVMDLVAGGAADETIRTLVKQIHEERANAANAVMEKMGVAA